MKRLHIAKDFSLPRESLLHVWSVLAVRGAGKTYMGSVLVEEILDAKMMPVIVIDPMDAWWGLKASADGKSPGYPIIVMGGTHADVPLEPTGGALVADFFIEHRQSLILVPAHGDHRWPKAQQVRFVRDFGARLYERNAGQLVFLAVDEADIFANQRPGKDELECLGVMEDIVKRGRKPGIFPLLITQRSSNLNKNVLDETEMLVAMRTMSPRDQEALKSWFQHLPKAQQERKETLLKTWAKLPNGTAWFWCPPMDLFQQVKIRERRTFNSSATPKFGEKPKEPKVLAPVDLEVLKQRMAATIERAKQTDPKELQREVVRLRAELARKPIPSAVPVKEKRIEIPVLGPREAKRIERAAAAITNALPILKEAGEKLRAGMVEKKAGPIENPVGPHIGMHGYPVLPRESAPLKSRHESRHAVGIPGDVRLGKAERLILTVLSQYPQGRTVTQVALLTGYAVDGGAFRNPLGKLRSAFFVEGGRGDVLRITDTGRTVMVGHWSPLPVPGQDLLDYWMRRLGHAEREIVRVLAEAYPKSLTAFEVAEHTRSSKGEPYDADGGAFRNPLGRLRTLELVVGRGSLRISDTLMETT
jgi:hypothetical protein